MSRKFKIVKEQPRVLSVDVNLPYDLNVPLWDVQIREADNPAGRDAEMFFQALTPNIPAVLHQHSRAMASKGGRKSVEARAEDVADRRREIKELYNDGVGPKDIASRFNISLATVYRDLGLKKKKNDFSH